MGFGGGARSDRSAIYLEELPRFASGRLPRGGGQEVKTHGGPVEGCSMPMNHCFLAELPRASWRHVVPSALPRPRPPGPEPRRLQHPAGCDATGTLLKDVGQLVTQQLLAVGRLRIVLARSEVDVGALSEGERAIEEASGPTWTRTSAKLELKQASILFWTESGRGCPEPRDLTVKLDGRAKGSPGRSCAAPGCARVGKIGFGCWPGRRAG